MTFFLQVINGFKIGGALMLPLSILCIITIALIFDKFLFYKKFINLPQDLLNLIETYSFNWQEFADHLKKLPSKNCYQSFFSIILHNKQQPIWWLESRAEDEARLIEKKLNSGMWILETIITTSPLLGLLGTITGMMSSFKIIGENGMVNPTGITSGVAESLIATGFGLTIAVIALFAFNFFSRTQDQLLEELERLGTRVIDHIRLDREIK
jgi:biopolymer transport protein ExbB